MSWLQRRGRGGGSLDVLSEAAANSRSEPTTKRWSDAWGKARDSMSAAHWGRHVPPKQRSEVAWTKRYWAEAVEHLDGPPHSSTAVAGGAPEGGMNSGAYCCSRGHRERGST
jgi:hypothetical protein